MILSLVRGRNYGDVHHCSTFPMLVREGGVGSHLLNSEPKVG